MKKALICSFTFLLVLFLSCDSDKPAETSSPLEGVWELVSGEWDTQDTTWVLPSPGLTMKSMKYYSKGHFFVIGKDAPGAESHALSGKYTTNGDEYTEIIEFSSMENVGENVVIKYRIEGDILSLESDWFNEKWKRIE